jgi:hypothetical protein
MVNNIGRRGKFEAIQTEKSKAITLAQKRKARKL